ncbi:MAG TPA: tetratricopeptide repeat protein [Bacteroidia bacterium]|jgi:tetratricopeptide (TPR) repeat protein|nr:tetratricopeptide repeat protein [Bacteroidia bacterium]
MRRSVYRTLWIALLLPAGILHAQNRKIDSLLRTLRTSNADTNRVNVLNDLSWAYRKFNADTALLLGNQGLALAEQLNFIPGKKQSFTNLGGIQYLLGNYQQSLDLYFKAEALLKNGRTNSEKNKLATVLDDIAMVYAAEGNYTDALVYHFKALPIHEATADKKGMASSNGNIASVYADQGDYDRAVEYGLKAIQMDQEIGDNGRLATFLGNLGNVYNAKKEFGKAEDCFLRALSIDSAAGDQNGIAIQYENLGSMFDDKGDLSTALAYYFRALDLEASLGMDVEYAISLGDIGSVYMEKGDFKKAERYLTMASAKCDSQGIADVEMQIENMLYKLYQAKGKWNDAYLHFKKYVSLKDTIANEENTRKQTRIEMQYQFDKQHAADSIHTAEKNAQDKLKHEQEIRQQKLYTFGGAGGFALMLMVAIISMRAYRNKQKANGIISRQKELVEEKQKEILDSIRYAKRIQRSLLPGEKIIHKNMDRLNRK